MLFDFFKKSSVPTLDPQTANQILNDIFEKCEREPNTIPIEVLTSYRNYRRERYSLQKGTLAVVLILFFMLPLLFLMPAFSLDLSADSEPGSPVYHIEVDTFLPISRITAVIDGHNVSVYETGDCTYSIEPTRNGRMTVTVTLANRQYLVQEILVDTVDREAPQLISNQQKKRHVYLYLEDKDSGIDYDGIYAVYENGERAEPLSFDRDTGCVEFAYPDTMMNVYIPDMAGNRLQLIVSVEQNN